MAIYHNRTRIFGRQAKDKAGVPIAGQQVSMLSKAAYRSGDRLLDERRDLTFDYRSRSHETVQTGILAPENAPAWLHTNEAREGAERQKQAAMRGKLWNTIETVEKRKDSQLAREFELALPIELDEVQRIELLREWCQSEIVSRGYVVDYAVHRSKDEGNPHAHVLCTMRPVDPDTVSGFGKKPDMAGKFTGRGIVGDGAKADLNDWRETWAVAQNRALEAAGSAARVDHRTLEAQGIDRVPGTHIGVAAAAMEKNGMETERVKLSRWAKMENYIRPVLRALERTGEVAQHGAGETWWERAQTALEWGVKQGRELIRDESSVARRTRDSASWQDYVINRAQPGPEPGREIEPTR